MEVISALLHSLGSQQKAAVSVKISHGVKVSGKKRKQKLWKEFKENTRECVSLSFPGQRRHHKSARGHCTIAKASLPLAGC